MKQARTLIRLADQDCKEQCLNLEFENRSGKKGTVSASVGRHAVLNKRELDCIICLLTDRGQVLVFTLRADVSASTLAILDSWYNDKCERVDRHTGSVLRDAAVSLDF